MKTIRNEVVAMPMLRVRCVPYLGQRAVLGVDSRWPEYVQTLPPVGSLMENEAGDKRAYVKHYVFRCDGIIEIELTKDNPLS